MIHRRYDGIELRLMSSPANRRLHDRSVVPIRAESERENSYLKSIMRVPTKLATPRFSKATERRRQTLAVVRLNSTSVSMNFQ
jgi:hypothetical protein